MLLQKLSMYLDLVMVVVTVVIVTLVIVTLSGFALGSTIESKTKGIWMWCVPHLNKAGGHASLTHTDTHTHTHTHRHTGPHTHTHKPTHTSPHTRRHTGPPMWKSWSNI